MRLLAAFAIALLAGIGVGGGGLLVLYLTLVEAMPQAEAQGVNLLFFFCAAGAAFLVNRKKRTFPWKTVLLLAIGGTVFALLGASLATMASPSLLRRGFGGLLMASGLLTLLRGRKKAS